MPAPFTQQAPSATPGRRYGDFSLKVPYVEAEVAAPVPEIVRSFGGAWLTRQVYMGAVTFLMPMWIMMAIARQRVRVRLFSAQHVFDVASAHAIIRYTESSAAKIIVWSFIAAEHWTRTYDNVEAYLPNLLSPNIEGTFILGVYHWRLIQAADESIGSRPME